MPATLHTHKLVGRESTVCGRGSANPAFTTTDDAKVTCPRCRARKQRRCRTCKCAPWTCRSCGLKTCEHLCINKTSDGRATCGRCKRNSFRW